MLQPEILSKLSSCTKIMHLCIRFENITTLWYKEHNLDLLLGIQKYFLTNFNFTDWLWCLYLTM